MAMICVGHDDKLSYYYWPVKDCAIFLKIAKIDVLTLNDVSMNLVIWELLVGTANQSSLKKILGCIY